MQGIAGDDGHVDVRESAVRAGAIALDADLELGPATPATLSGSGHLGPHARDEQASASRERERALLDDHSTCGRGIGILARRHHQTA